MAGDKELYELVCPFIGECRYANNKCCGYRPVECRFFLERIDKVKQYIRELVQAIRNSMEASH